MQTTVQTLEGTFIVPSEKQVDLIAWLNQNAIKVGRNPVYETKTVNSDQSSSSTTQLFFS